MRSGPVHIHIVLIQRPRRSDTEGAEHNPDGEETLDHEEPKVGVL